MTKWEYLTAPILTQAVRDPSTLRLRGKSWCLLHQA